MTILRTNGNVGFGTTNPTQRVEVYGAIRAGIGGGGPMMTARYNNNAVLYDHNNGNISVNAVANGLFFGYYTTNVQYWHTAGVERMQMVVIPC